MLPPREPYSSLSPEPKPKIKRKSGHHERSSRLSPERKPKRSRASRACDVCRNSHRKCPGPAPGLKSCERCTKQHKECTWNEYAARSDRPPSSSVSPKVRRLNIEPPQSAQLEPMPLFLPIESSNSSRPLTPSSSSGASEPGTPGEAHLPHLPETQPFKHANNLEESYAQLLFDLGESLQRYAVQDPKHEPIQHQNEPPVQVLPDYHADLLAAANKHNLMLFAMPLQPWEERQKDQSQSDVVMWCVPPSYIDPSPSQDEMLAVLPTLMIEPEPSLPTGIFPAIDSATAINPTMDPALSCSSEEEPLTLLALADLSDNDEAKPTAASAPAITTPSNSVKADEASSQRQPEFFIELMPESGFESLSPYRHSLGRDRFDAFLASPSFCSATPMLPSSAVSWLEGTVAESISSKLDTSWNEVMPEVLQVASQNAALNECLRLYQASTEVLK